MSAAELAQKLQSNDKNLQKELFVTHFGVLSAIANRYAKNQAQAEEMLHQGFQNCFLKLQSQKLSGSKHNQISDLPQFFQKEFIVECVAFIKNIRSEYYVSSTVYASSDTPSKNYNLFDNNDSIDYSQLETEVLVTALQQMVPSQRLAFNLHVIDGYSLSEVASVLESSEATVKSNLEKARYNFQKNINKNLKTSKA
ncbi:MAG: sigma-70 family RNA polymerase sigma factor [Bacteroidia bacterium]|nr:sigma-70 family RNA polymerase sigma factor [Bacteroidia bacterium]